MFSYNIPYLFAILDSNKVTNGKPIAFNVIQGLFLDIVSIGVVVSVVNYSAYDFVRRNTERSVISAALLRRNDSLISVILLDYPFVALRRLGSIGVSTHQTSPTVGVEKANCQSDRPFV